MFDGAGARLFLNDDFEQTSTGTLHIDIAGPSASEYDRVVVDEDATLAGTLDMNSQDTSAYDIGDRMKLVNAAVNGTFETIAGLSVGVVDGLHASLAVYYEDTVAVNFADNTAVYARVTISGDSDGSNSVDVGDLGNLSTSWNSEGTWVNGDYTGDGFIDVADMGVLATNWNATYPAAAAAAGVPEPGTLALLALGAAAGLAARPRAAVS